MRRGRSIRITGVAGLLLGLSLGLGFLGLWNTPALAQACGTLSGSAVTVAANCTGPASLDGTVDDLTVNGSVTISGGATGIDQNGDALSSLLILNGGSVSGTTNGILANQTITSFINQGSISGTGGVGINIAPGGSITTLNNTSTGTITGDAAGIRIQTGTSLGTLTNSGSITGTSAGSGSGIEIVGTLTTLTNNAAGTIGVSTGRTGIYVNGGTLSNFTNAGRIQGGVSEAILITGSGTLTSFTNSGTIAGDITNSSANTLTINGGSGSTYGILTGTSGNTGSGDRGTISNNNSNLLFNSGNIFLNNNVFLSGNSLINSGATVRIDNTITVNGIYQQTGGGLLITTTSNGTVAGQLVVTGNATVTGSSITISGAGMSAGQTFTIVDAAGTGTYNSNTVTVAVTNGLGATLSTAGSDLVVTLFANASNTYIAKGNAAGGTAAQIGGTLDTISGSSSSASTAFKSEVLNVLDTLPTAAQGRAMKQLAPTQIAPVAQMGRNAITTVSTAIGRHQQISMEHAEKTGLSTGAEERRSALWGEVLGGAAQQNGNGQVDGYRMVDYGLVFGMDHRVAADTLAGAALSWMHADADGEDNAAGSSSELDSYQLTLYGSQRMGRLVIDGQLGAGWNQYQQQRRIGFLGRMAGADYDGQQYLARVLVGYDIPLGSMTLTPQAGLRALHARYDGYTETGAGAANLTVHDNDTEAVTHDIGAKLAWTLATSAGELKPEVSAAWLHDYVDSPVVNSGVMGGQAFAVSVPRTSSDGLRLGLAATLSGDSRFALRGAVESEFRSDYQSHTGMVRSVWAF
jgi:outer membrane autotransporter protein